MDNFRVLESAKRPMQRLGYLKYVVSRCVVLEATNLDTLGRDLTETVARNVNVPLNPDIADYVRRRLTDGAYRSLRGRVAAWERNPSPAQAAMEIQDLYLADPRMPSRTGKLVAEDWRKYPYLGIYLGLVRAGTWSPFERGLILLRLAPKGEMEAFRAYDATANPLLLSTAQRLYFLFCLLENDGDVIVPLYKQLLILGDFSDRDAGDLLPVIFRAIGQRFWNRSLPVEERTRLDRLLKIADSIESWRGRSYAGGGANLETITPRLEPFADLGLLVKDNPYRYEYHLGSQGRVFINTLDAAGDIGAFLENSFFQSWAGAFGPTDAVPAAPEQVRTAMVRAWNEIRSPLGYAPILDVALLAGIYALTEQGVFFEIATARQFLRDWQKESPTAVRFSVDRMGALAHVRLLNEGS